MALNSFTEMDFSDALDLPDVEKNVTKAAVVRPYSFDQQIEILSHFPRNLHQLSNLDSGSKTDER